ncbi:unnamed protein product [Adineta steineri]|uniref:Carrier domain-containing protein n=1 Tax=Adineta steineri TaxID=433720 RepID=A0A819PMV0_9BILA|nr:unnamed protein product [Adineta steineri]CAF4015308.1 unnamed protein product [Adineta steineri]
MNKKETVIERTQTTVARLLGATTVDRIVIDRSPVSQGMDSLVAVSLYNWLSQEAATKEHDSDFDLINENEVQLSNATTYIDLENSICIHQSNQNNTPTLFCITQISNDNNNEDLFTFFIDKLSNRKNKASSNDIYILQIPLIQSSLSSSSISTYAQNLIIQMGRV